MKNPCWEGYEAYGFKEKGGKRVPNCVPKKESTDRMPYHLEMQSDGHNFPKGKAIVVDTKGHHYSQDPIPVKRAKAQKRVLESKDEDKGRK